MTLRFTQSGRPSLVIPLLLYFQRSTICCLITVTSVYLVHLSQLLRAPTWPPVNGVPCSGLFQSSPVLTAPCNCHFQIWSSFTAGHTRWLIKTRALLKTDLMEYSVRLMSCFCFRFGFSESHTDLRVCLVNSNALEFQHCLTNNKNDVMDPGTLRQIVLKLEP